MSSQGHNKKKQPVAEQEQSLNLFIYFIIVPILTVVSGLLHRLDARPFFLLCMFSFIVFVLGIPLFNRKFLVFGIVFTAVIVFGGLVIDTAVLPKDFLSGKPNKKQQQANQQTYQPIEQEDNIERETLDFRDLPGTPIKTFYL